MTKKNTSTQYVFLGLDAKQQRVFCVTFVAKSRAEKESKMQMFRDANVVPFELGLHSLNIKALRKAATALEVAIGTC